MSRYGMSSYPGPMVYAQASSRTETASYRSSVSSLSQLYSVLSQAVLEAV